MWYPTFEQRLSAWNDLRLAAADSSLDQALLAVNAWWSKTPWRAYHLHWDDQETWPDPWQLLNDNIYCDLARGLGMLYTIIMLDRNDIQNSVMVESDYGNLVLINEGKYILNWNGEMRVNTIFEQTNPRHSVSQSDLQLKLN